MLEEREDSMIREFIESLPKAELHLHIEGTLEPEMMLEMSKRNCVQIPWDNVEDIKKAYQFNDLQSFLDVYYKGSEVLLEEKDFYDLTWAYFKKCYAQNIVYAEIFFDPQTHTSRGVPFESVINGIGLACDNARRILGIDSKIIMCFLRHLSQDDAFETLIESLPYSDLIHGVGLDSSEVGNPPDKFTSVFSKARSEGYEVVAHAGEEGPPSNIWGSILKLGAKRIDHGVACMQEGLLKSFLRDNQIPLTVCPVSNVKLKVFETMEDHNLKQMLDFGILVTVNSDDPAYFGGYLNENFFECQKALNLSLDDVVTLVKNSFRASFMEDDLKDHYISLVDLAIEPREVHKYSTASSSGY